MLRENRARKLPRSIPCKINSKLYSAHTWMVKRQSRWRSKCWFIPWEVGAWQASERLNTEDILISCWTEKSMLHSFILFKRCRTCRSQSRCWTCGRRGTFSISWEWRARSKDCGQSSDRSNRTGRRSSTKTFRYIFLFDVWACEKHHKKVKGKDLFWRYMTSIWTDKLSFLIRSIQVYHCPASPAKDKVVLRARQDAETGSNIDTEDSISVRVTTDPGSHEVYSLLICLTLTKIRNTFFTAVWIRSAGLTHQHGHL